MADQMSNAFPADSIETKDLKFLVHPVTNLPLHHQTGPMVLERAKGIYVWDNHGKQYLEGLAGLWCTALGYGEDELIRAAEQQLRKLSYSQLFGSRTNEPSVLLAEKLSDMVPFDASRVFFGLSGSDANDTQVKLMWYYHNAIGNRDKKKIISREKGYHGVTVASGSLTGLPAFHKHFDLPIPGILHTNSPHYYREALEGESEDDFVVRLTRNLEALILKEGPETIAAFIAEPVQGGGGVIVPPDGYFEAIQKTLKKYNILFIDDEVICGFGRTGSAFGADTYQLKPTTMSLAKSLSSAYLPISAVVIPEFMYEPIAEVSADVGVFGHGFTYSGHPVSSAVALRTLELMEERMLFEHAAAMGEVFQERLNQLSNHQLVGEARGVGLIGAIELVSDKEDKTPFPPEQAVGAFCASRALINGLIVRPLGDSIAICPPLIISERQLDELFTKLEIALNETLDTLH